MTIPGGGAPPPAAVAQMYDAFTDLLLEAMGGNIHLGLWRPGEADCEHGAAGVPSVRVERATDRMTDLVAERLGLTAGQRVLDVGCGSGRPAERLAALRHVAVTGFTVSTRQEELARARGRLPGAGDVDFIVADMTMPLPFPAEWFDAAYAVESLIHVGDMSGSLRHVADVVRPGGRIVIADACVRGELEPAQRELAARVCGLFAFAPLPTMDDYRENAAKAGLVVAAVEDLDEEVRPSYATTAAAVRRAAESLEPGQAAELGAIAELLEAFGALPQLGYVVLTLTRP
jgi:cyclopropane fatty-acyl-phospholipid synthase-like methyltransferase